MGAVSVPPQVNGKTLRGLRSYRKSPKGMRMDSIFSMFDECDADVLFLFDSCQAMPQPLDSFGKGFVSAITATGSDPNPIGIAAEVGPDSFTSSLIKVLGLMARGPHGPQSFTESDLYNKLDREISKAPARLEEKSDGTLVFDSNGVIPVRRKRRCPFLRPLSRNKIARPISIPILHRFGRKKESGLLFNVDKDSFDPPASLGQADIRPEVLVSFRLTPDDMKFDDKDGWARLMLRISDAVSGQGVTVGDIKIEGLFPSDSSLLLLRIPMDIWNLLRRHRSATFIGNVYGENGAKQFEDAVRARMLELRHTEAEKTELSNGSFSSSTSSDGLLKIAKHNDVPTDDECVKPETSGSILEDQERTQHRLTTKEEPNFQCEVKGCGKLFSRSYNFNAHMETHNEKREYPFPCTVANCNKKFVRKADLQRHHQSIHIKERPHKCNFCSRLFARKDTLRR